MELVGPAAELRFVSRGGLKLERALDAFALDPADRVALDVGASTGGFTDLLLRRGARRVYAVDVGHGQLAWSLRSDPRVVVMERTNIRQLASLPEQIECAVIDVSFISLRLALPPVAALLAPGAWVVALVKPQFEAGRAEADRGKGVIRDPAIHRRILGDLLGWLPDALSRAPTADTPTTITVPYGLVASPITGRDGNHEYLLWLAVETLPKRDTIPSEPPLPTATAQLVAPAGGARRRPIDLAEVDRVVAEVFAGTPAKPAAPGVGG